MIEGIISIWIAEDFDCPSGENCLLRKFQSEFDSKQGELDSLKQEALNNRLKMVYEDKNSFLTKCPKRRCWMNMQVTISPEYEPA